MHPDPEIKSEGPGYAPCPCQTAVCGLSAIISATIRSLDSRIRPFLPLFGFGCRLVISGRGQWCVVRGWRWRRCAFTLCAYSFCLSVINVPNTCKKYSTSSACGSGPRFVGGVRGARRDTPVSSPRAPRQPPTRPTRLSHRHCIMQLHGLLCHLPRSSRRPPLPARSGKTTASFYLLFKR